MPPRTGPSTTSRLRAAARGGASSAKRPSPIQAIIPLPSSASPAPSGPRSYATATLGSLKLPDDYVPPTQPLSARIPETRKSQLLRTYTSLLRTTPLILLFQHSNLTSPEWVAVRRELVVKLRELPQGPGDPVNFSDFVRIEVLSTKLFSYALKLTEFYDPDAARKGGEKWTHDLSKAAMGAVRAANVTEDTAYAQLQHLIVGPMAALTMPVTSPAHLAAALSILAPSPAFPAPKRRKRAAYHDPEVQSGLAKLLLVGGRVEGRVMDREGVRWIGEIEGGLNSLRAQLVHVLHSAGMGLTNVLQTPGKSLWLALESRRSVLEEEAGGGKKAEAAEEETKA